jgi:broad specificity phosphatase PhoE
MAIKRLVLIRPGETDWNRQGRWQGWVAAPLNEHGWQQARKLAHFIRHIGMAALYSSDLRRARETAECLSEHIGYPAILDARLRERNIGLWQGLTLDEMRAWYTDEYTALLKDIDGYMIPGGESRLDVKKRVMVAYEDIITADKGETVGILSHTTTLKVLLAEIVPGYNPIEVDVGNTSVTTLRRLDKNRWELVAVNDIMHLQGLEAQAVPEVEIIP